MFTQEAFPLSLVILIDDDLKSKDAAQMTPTLRAITGGISANDEAIVARFDLDFYPAEGFTSDLDAIPADLGKKRTKDSQRDRPVHAVPHLGVGSPSDHALGVGEPPLKVSAKAGPRPTKALDDAIHSAAALLHDRGQARRKMILIVSDGVNGPQFNRFSYEDSLDALLHNNISVYSLAVGNSLIKKKFQRLTSYSDDSGGDIYYTSTSTGIEKLYSQMTEEARHEYTLGCYVPRDVSSATPYHKIEVRVTRPAVTTYSSGTVIYASAASLSPADSGPPRWTVTR